MIWIRWVCSHLLCQFEQSHFLHISDRVCPPVTLHETGASDLHRQGGADESFIDSRLLPSWLLLVATAFHSFHPERPTYASRWVCETQHWFSKRKTCSTVIVITFFFFSQHTEAGEPFDNNTNSKMASWGSRMFDPGHTRHGSHACSPRWRV